MKLRTSSEGNKTRKKQASGEMSSIGITFTQFSIRFAIRRKHISRTCRTHVSYQSIDIFMHECTKITIMQKTFLQSVEAWCQSKVILH